MRAAVVDGGRFVVRDVADPEPGPNELLVEVHGCGVCGSDVKTYGFMPDGTIMGHEFAGRVVRSGASVADDWPVGTAVASMPVVGCADCRYCTSGDPARCVTPSPLGLGARAGAFAELVTVTAAETVGLDERLDPVMGALVEPLAVGLHAVERGAASAADRLLVIGAGPVGVSILLWARERGITDVTVADPVEHRRRSARRLGATRVIDPAHDELGTGYDLVAECVGAPGLIASCLDAVAPGGRVVVAGVCMTADTFMPVAADVKDVTVSFVSFYTRAEFATAADALARGALDVDGFVSGFVSLGDLQDTVESLATPTDQQKIIVTPAIRSQP